MMDQNTCFAYLNMELPDDIRRLKEAGYYDAAIARIDACLAEDWTASQNQPLHPQGALPVNPTPHGVDAWRQGLLAHREILRRLPRDYTLTADQLLNKLQATLRDFTAEEFAALPGRWIGVLWRGRSAISTAPLKRWWLPIPTLPPVSWTRPSRSAAGIVLNPSTTRWCAPAQPAQTSPCAPASA